MGYIAPEIKDRIAVGDNKYRMTTESDGRVSFEPAPDSVTEPGTDVNKEMLQEAFDAIEEHDSKINNNSNALTAINITSANYATHPTNEIMKRATFSIPHNRYLLCGRVNLPDYSTVTQRFIEISMVITKLNTLAVGFNRSHAYISSRSEDIVLVSGNNFIEMTNAAAEMYGFVTTSGFYIDTYPDHMPTGTLYYMQI